MKQGGGKNWNVSAQCLILQSFIDLLVKMEVQQKLACLLCIPGLGTLADFVRSVRNAKVKFQSPSPWVPCHRATLLGNCLKAIFQI